MADTNKGIQAVTLDGKIMEYIPASFGVDTGHIDRFIDVYVPNGKYGVTSYPDERRQLDILQEECAELIQAISKIRRMKDLAKQDEAYIDSKQVVDRWYEARANLTEELAHVAISSAIVSRILHVSQDEIDAEVKRKDDLLKASERQGIFIDEAHGPDMTGGI